MPLRLGEQPPHEALVWVSAKYEEGMQAQIQRSQRLARTAA